MAKKTTFSKRPKVSFTKKPKPDLSFNFGFNVMTKSQKRSYTRRLRKAGHTTGGGS